MPENQKALGAYYTGDPIAAFLAGWAIRTGRDTVLEPSFGDGAFLRACAEQIGRLGGQAENQLHGCEIDPRAFDAVRKLFGGQSPSGHLVLGDFFQTRPDHLRVTAVVGNPPFIRYQRFSGETRDRALECASLAGIELSELSSSWAPFVVHATRFLEEGGRLAMVLPGELLHAAYARPVLRHLQGSFSRVTVLTFNRKLFPQLSQETVLVLGEGFGAASQGITLRNLAGIESLQSAFSPDSRSSVLDVRELERGNVKASEFRIPPAASELYRRLATHTAIRRLGAIADVGIGYVTGGNDFFHLSEAEAEVLGINPADLRASIRRGRDLAGCGVRFTQQDWNSLAASGGKYRLFLPQGDLDGPANRHVEFGRQSGVSGAYKCRTRNPWWRVPWVVQPDLILTVMSGAGPRLVANPAGVVVTNSLHVVRLRGPGDATLIAASAVNTLTQLSAELEGHALGGGMLKLEPSEAGQILIPATPAPSTDYAMEVDRLVRRRDLERATALGDRFSLQDQLGLSPEEIDLLKQSLQTLRSWRQGR